VGCFSFFLLVVRLFLATPFRFFVFAFEPFEFAFESAFLFFFRLDLARMFFGLRDFALTGGVAPTSASGKRQSDDHEKHCP